MLQFTFRPVPMAEPQPLVPTGAANASSVVAPLVAGSVVLIGDEVPDEAVKPEDVASVQTSPVEPEAVMPVSTSQAIETNTVNVPEVPALHAEVDDDQSSSYDARSVLSSTASVTSSMLRFREENGRTYHAYKV